MSIRGSKESWGQDPGLLPLGRPSGSPLFHQLSRLLRERQPCRRHPRIRHDVRYGSLCLSR